MKFLVGAAVGHGPLLARAEEGNCQENLSQGRAAPLYQGVLSSSVIRQELVTGLNQRDMRDFALHVLPILLHEAESQGLTLSDYLVEMIDLSENVLFYVHNYIRRHRPDFNLPFGNDQRRLAFQLFNRIIQALGGPYSIDQMRERMTNSGATRRPKKKAKFPSDRHDYQQVELVSLIFSYLSYLLNTAQAIQGGDDPLAKIQGSGYIHHRPRSEKATERVLQNWRWYLEEAPPLEPQETADATPEEAAEVVDAGVEIPEPGIAPKNLIDLILADQGGVEQIKPDTLYFFSDRNQTNWSVEFSSAVTKSIRNSRYATAHDALLRALLLGSSPNGRKGIKLLTESGGKQMIEIKTVRRGRHWRYIGCLEQRHIWILSFVDMPPNGQSYSRRIPKDLCR